MISDIFRKFRLRSFANNRVESSVKIVSRWCVVMGRFVGSVTADICICSVTWFMCW